MTQADVLVVGGGVAGLAAAAELARRGRRVVLLEARNRLGGRIHTHRSAGDRSWIAELGAEFVHGDSPELIALLAAAGVRTRPADVPMRWWREGRWEEQPDFWQRVGSMADRIPVRSRGWSFDEFLRRDDAGAGPAERERTRAYLQSFNAAPASRLSAWSMRATRAGADDEDKFVVNGYDRLVRLLAKRCRSAGVEIRLDAPVAQIDWRHGLVHARGTGSRPGGRDGIQAAAAIITVPLGVLRRGDLRFRPALEQKRATIRRMGWGEVVRVIVRLHGGLGTQTWMPDLLRRGGGRAFGFIHAPALAIPVWWAPRPPAPVIVGWAGGPTGERLAGLPTRRLREVVLGSLVRLSGATPADVRRAMSEVLTHNWSADPFARGAYSYVAAGAERAAKQLARPVRGTLFFAGEATSEDTGTVHGALTSGMRAAREVLDIL